MEPALLQSQSPEVHPHAAASPSHSRRARRTHRATLRWGSFRGFDETFLQFGQAAGFGGTQIPVQTLPQYGRSLFRLEELKSRRFTAFDRQQRIARSLAALREPVQFQVTMADWQWFDEHSDLEDEFE